MPHAGDVRAGARSGPSDPPSVRAVAAPRFTVCFHGVGVPTHEREPGEAGYWVSRDRFLELLDWAGGGTGCRAQLRRRQRLRPRRRRTRPPRARGTRDVLPGRRPAGRRVEPLGAGTRGAARRRDGRRHPRADPPALGRAARGAGPRGGPRAAPRAGGPARSPRRPGSGPARTLRPPHAGTAAVRRRARRSTSATSARRGRGRGSSRGSASAPTTPPRRCAPGCSPPWVRPDGCATARCRSCQARAAERAGTQSVVCRRPIRPPRRRRGTGWADRGGRAPAAVGTHPCRNFSGGR